MGKARIELDVDESNLTRQGAQDRGSMARTSVCMATYNGAEFLREQLDSILSQLDADDEIVVVDDCSTDATPEILEEYAQQDKRVRVIARRVNFGYVRTFEQALREARGQYLLLSDQDDVWTTDHVEVLLQALGAREDTLQAQNAEQPGVEVPSGKAANMVSQEVVPVRVAATNLGTLGGPQALRGPYGQADWHLREADSDRSARNIAGILAGNMPYYGCAMGITATARDAGLLPFPAFLSESHDLWIALWGNVHQVMQHREERTVLRRFHAANASPSKPRGVGAALQSRVMLLRCLREIRRRQSQSRPGRN